MNELHTERVNRFKRDERIIQRGKDCTEMNGLHSDEPVVQIYTDYKEMKGLIRDQRITNR